MQKPIYHGKTIIHEVDNHKPIDLRIANEGMVTFDSPNVFPEYFFISIPLFDDVIQEDIDNWLYIMKHSSVGKDTTSPYMKKVAERLAVVKMTTEEHNEYIYYQKQAVHAQDILQSALSRGIDKGIKQGKAEGKIEGKIEGKTEVVKTMLAKNYPIADISAITGLSVDEIKKLQS